MQTDVQALVSKDYEQRNEKRSCLAKTMQKRPKGKRASE